MQRLKRIISLAAISAATAASIPGVAGAAAPIGSGSGPGATPSPGLIAAERAQSAPLDRFALINERSAAAAKTSLARPNEQLPAKPPAVTPPMVVATERAAIARDRLGDRALNIASPATRVASTTQGSPGFQYDDAAVGAGVMIGLVLLGTAGTFAVRRRSQLRHT